MSIYDRMIAAATIAINTNVSIAADHPEETHADLRASLYAANAEMEKIIAFARNMRPYDETKE